MRLLALFHVALVAAFVLGIVLTIIGAERRTKIIVAVAWTAVVLLGVLLLTSAIRLLSSPQPMPPRMAHFPAPAAAQSALPPKVPATKHRSTAAAAETRPAWIDAAPQVVDGAYQTSITVGPYTTRGECDAKLPEALQESLDHYVEWGIEAVEIGAGNFSPAPHLALH